MNHEHFGNEESNNENGAEWQILTEPDDEAPILEDAQDGDPQVEAPARGILDDLNDTRLAQEEAATIKEIRMDFRSELEELGDKVMDYEAYEGWEDELAEYYEEMQSHSQYLRPELAAKAESDATDIAFREKTTVRGDGAEKHLVPIEAYAGHFMRERIDALRNAIEGSDAADKTALIQQIEQFYETCLKHSEFLNPESQINMPPEVYEERRTRAHNDVIVALNGLNDMCRRFDVRPLTFRNFEDTNGANANLHNQEQIDRKKADRGMVELYYSIAFKDLAEKAELPDMDDDFQVVKYFHELGNDGGD